LGFDRVPSVIARCVKESPSGDFRSVRDRVRVMARGPNFLAVFHIFLEVRPISTLACCTCTKEVVYDGVALAQAILARILVPLRPNTWDIVLVVIAY